MWQTEATVETTGSAERVWSAWQDVAHWNAWHPMIRESTLDGSFTSGTHGTVTPVKGMKGGFVLTEVQDGKRWSSRAGMPGGTLDFIYELTPTPAGTRISMRAEISGPLTPLWRMMIGKQCEQGLPLAVQNLKTSAEQNTTAGAVA